jgi:cytochrome c oxidase subunit 4
VILTFITVGASYVNFGSDAVNVVIALTIATIKASLVALIFMHLRWDKPVNALIAVGGFLFLGIFLMFCVIDFDSRMDPPPPVLNSAVPTPVEPGAAAPPKPPAQ